MKMMDLPEQEKKLILRAAYFSYLRNRWMYSIFAALKKMSLGNKEIESLFKKMPCGVDITSDLMELAILLLPDISKTAIIKNELEKIRVFLMDKMKDE